MFLLYANKSRWIKHRSEAVWPTIICGEPPGTCTELSGYILPLQTGKQRKKRQEIFHIYFQIDVTFKIFDYKVAPTCFSCLPWYY